MMSFRGGRLRDFKLPLSTVWLAGDVAEAKGKQALYTQQAPQLLQSLRESAIVESVESSNRIEGVTVATDRLRPLVLGNAHPKDRSEEEIQGYRTALQRIHEAANDLPTNSGTLQELHRTIQEGAGDAGQWKRVETDIIEVRPGYAPRVRFRTVPVDQTPVAVEELCISYRHALDQEQVPPLVAVACLVFDFLCIHPFRDGNGRVSRLLTLLALYHHGYEVGRYVSLERLVEETKEDYYAALQASSAGWHEGEHDLIPWLNYFLSILRRAYLQFEERAGRIQSVKGAKSEAVESVIAEVSGPFTLAELAKKCPTASRDTIRLVLRKLKKAEIIECIGRGPGAKWRKKG